MFEYKWLHLQCTWADNGQAAETVFPTMGRWRPFEDRLNLGGRVRWIRNCGIICSGWRLRSISAVNKSTLHGFQFNRGEDLCGRDSIPFHPVQTIDAEDEEQYQLRIWIWCCIWRIVIYCRNGWVDLHHNNDLLPKRASSSSSKLLLDKSREV